MQEKHKLKEGTSWSCMFKTSEWCRWMTCFCSQIFPSQRFDSPNTHLKLISYSQFYSTHTDNKRTPSLPKRSEKDPLTLCLCLCPPATVQWREYIWTKLVCLHLDRKDRQVVLQVFCIIYTQFCSSARHIWDFWKLWQSTVCLKKVWTDNMSL